MKALTLFLMLLIQSAAINAQIYAGQKGKVKLKGEAPQETIVAESSSCVGKIDLKNRRFNIVQNMGAFVFSQGDLQSKHAREDYFEFQTYPISTFSGEIINDTDFSRDGIYNVTARGKFKLHGVEKELKIPAVITLANGTARITSEFDVFLSDYNIKIPRLVALKVAEVFKVTVELDTKTN